MFLDTNRLIVTPTYDAYLENGTDIGLTVGILILSYTFLFVNIHKFIEEIEKYIESYYFSSILQTHFHNHSFSNENKINLQIHLRSE